MPTLPWLPLTPSAERGTTAVVLASRFRVRRLHSVPRFLLDSLLIHRQTRATDGALGVSLVAHPLRREFLTLSAWRDRASLDAMVRTEPHRSAMRRHRPAMQEATVTGWEAPAEALPITWADARQHLVRAQTASRPS